MIVLALIFTAGEHLRGSSAPLVAQSSVEAIVPYVPPVAPKDNQLRSCAVIDAEHPDQPGIYKIGKEVSAPIVKHNVTATMTKEARAYAHEHGGTFSASSLIGFVVDQEGQPQEICLKKAAGFGLDEEAARAVSQYRFSPAKVHNSPVAVRLVVEVEFQSY